MAHYTIGLISPKSTFFFKDEQKNSILKGLLGFETHQRYWSGLGPALPILASLSAPNFTVEIIDENVEELDYNKPFDLVAVTAMTHQAIRAYQICGEFKKRQIPTILGGIHASTLPEEAALYADTVVVGEAENCWPILLEDFQKENLKKIYKSTDYKPVILSQTPVPRYDLLLNKNYSIIWVNTTRGCPYDCEFCSASNYFGKKYRCKAVSQICQEIEFIKKTFKHILIGFGDDNMFVNRAFTYELVHKFIDLNFNWIAQSDISIGRIKSY